MFNLAKQRFQKSGPDFTELGNSPQGDIILHPRAHPYYSGESQILESSLSRYLQYLYIEYPPWVNIAVNGKYICKQNPYSHLKGVHSQAFVGEKGDKFAI
jgi:hypothetical protein